MDKLHEDKISSNMRINYMDKFLVYPHVARILHEDTPTIKSIFFLGHNDRK